MKFGKNKEMDEKIEEIEQRMQEIEQRLESVKKEVSDLNMRVERTSRVFSQFEGIEDRVIKMESLIKEMEWRYKQMLMGLGR